jgi:dolichol-phosphate mannosyltransferase
VTTAVAAPGPDTSTNPQDWRVCIVMPTRNDALVLERVVTEVREAFVKNGLREPILVITDDSRDGTRALAARLGVPVVIGGGRGLGYAMQRGLRAALAFKPDVVMSMDADGQSDPSEVMRFLTPIARGEADMVVGSRFCEPGLIHYPYRRINRFGIVVLTGILRWLTGLALTDSHGGLRAMRPEVVREFDLVGTHTYVQEAIIDAHEKGFRVCEVASVWRPRVHGRSQVVGSIPRYVMYTLPILLVRSGVHVKWLYSAGFLLMGAAMTYFGVVLWEAGFNIKAVFPRLPSFIFIALMIMVGVQLFSLGFLAELIKNVKARVDRLDRGLPVEFASPGRPDEPRIGR